MVLEEAGDFLKSVGRAINNEYGVGQNEPRGLATPDADDPNQITPFGALGDFANRIDQTAQRRYVENGYIRNIKPRFFETLHQTPDMTIIVKKQIFSSLQENYRMEFMDKGEKLFMKAAKRLFQNKAEVVSIYEKLSKIDKIVESKGVVDDYLTPIILSGVDSLTSVGLGGIIDEKTRKSLDTIRKLNNYNITNNFTTWIQDRDTFTVNPTGNGTGVIELTMVAQGSTTVSTKFASGSANLKIEDPYNLMRITEQDIDKALAESVGTRNQGFFSLAERELDKVINDLTQRLNKNRNLRGVPTIKVRISEDSALYKRVSAFIDGIGEIIFNYDAGFLGITSNSDGVSNGEIQFDPSATEGPAGLNESDQNLLSQILKNTFTWLNQQKNRRTSLEDLDLGSGKEGESLSRTISYVRRKMRMYFANKHMIQAMDVVHVYMSTKTRTDDLITGLNQTSFTGGTRNLLSLIDSNLSDIQNIFDTGLNFFGAGNKRSFNELEKNAIVGADFPSWLWTSMRNDFTRQAAGVHTFAGYVKSVSSSYSGGKYELSVGVVDNANYFKLGKINLQPGVDNIEEELYNPLTPFELEFDSSSGLLNGEIPTLLPENKAIFETNLVKAKNGARYRGSILNEFLYSTVDGERVDAQPPFNFKRVFYDPDGFVYRWKSGIGTLINFGPRYRQLVRRGRQPSVSNNPFAGQDVVNVLSILVTGQPYNFNTF